MMDGSTAPDIEDFFKVLRDEIANYSGAYVSLLNKHIGHLFDSLVTFLNTAVKVCKEISKRLTPACSTCAKLIFLPKHFRASQNIDVISIDRLHDCFDERILLRLKISLFNRCKEIASTLLCNEESNCRAAAFESDLSGIL